ncbi:MAG: hypothetical protein QNJ18_01785 [Xenococcaceae cyanobacterium MO_167.B52]|nr:hypothetical protein [Xenococcaceae cyanobacterium MO_167.B52]
MSNFQINKLLSFSISELKKQYQNHPSMFEVRALSFQLKQEKLKNHNVYQSLKKSTRID